MDRYILNVGDISSLDYNIYVLDSDDESSTSREFESVQVPGRTGDLHFDNGRYENISRTYKCVCMSDASRLIPAFVSAILSQPGYKRIEDTLHDDYYKIGEFTGNVTPAFAKGKDAARVDLTFDCKPQKYLKIGEIQRTLATGNNVIDNPTYYASYPLLEITGNGNLGIGPNTITIAGNTETLILDLELGDCYEKTSHGNRNSKVSWTAKPSIKSGQSGITVPSGMTVKLTPRWWFL